LRKDVDELRQRLDVIEGKTFIEDLGKDAND
jgi:hypothetical protein